MIKKSNKTGFIPLETKGKRRNNKMFLTGFTLVEMLMVSALIGVVSLGVFSVLNKGLKIWQRVNQTFVSEDTTFFSQKFTLDLRNAFKFTNISFIGQAENLSFATLVNSPFFKKRTIGKISYSYDSGKHQVYRNQSDYSDIYSPKDTPGPRSIVLDNINSLKFQYYYYDAQKKEYIWDNQWSKQELPLAVRIEFEIENNNQAVNYVNTINIPINY